MRPKSITPKLMKSKMGTQVTEKERQVMDFKKEIRLGETQIKEIQEKVRANWERYGFR